MIWEHEELELFQPIPDVHSEHGGACVSACPFDDDGGASIVTFSEHGDGTHVVNLDRRRARLLMTQLEACIFPESVAAERVRRGIVWDEIDKLEPLPYEAEVVRLGPRLDPNDSASYAEHPLGGSWS